MIKTARTISSLLLETFDSIAVPVFLTDNNENVIACNATACGIFKYSADDLAGRSIYDFVTLAGSFDSSILTSGFPDRSEYPLVKRRW